MNAHAFGNVDDELHIGIIIVICASGNLWRKSQAVLAKVSGARALTSTYWSAIRM